MLQMFIHNVANDLQLITYSNIPIQMWGYTWYDQNNNRSRALSSHNKGTNKKNMLFDVRITYILLFHGYAYGRLSHLCIPAFWHYYKTTN
jgi:hypothetical protein